MNCAKRLMVVSFLFSFILIVASCGRHRNNNDIYLTNICSTASNTTSHVLTIFTDDIHSFNRGLPLRLAERAMTNNWAEQGKDFSIDIISYSHRDRESALQRLHVLIMAGQSPDIIMLDHDPWTDSLSLYNFLNSGAFADIWELIDNCPYTNRDDFYVNVLESWEMDGMTLFLCTDFCKYSLT